MTCEEFNIELLRFIDRPIEFYKKKNKIIVSVVKS